MSPQPRSVPFHTGTLLGVAMAMAGCSGVGVTTAVTDPAATHTAPASLAPTPTAVAQAESEKNAVDPAIIAADNGFGLTLFQALQASTAGNIAISPLSVSVAFQILYNGAVGRTQQAMATTLQLGAWSPAAMNAANAALQASLLTADPLLNLVIANSLWTQSRDSTVLPSFTQTVETYYGATLGDLSGAPANVNTWIANATQGLITNILPPGDYSNAAAIIANALYFKGPWSIDFDPSQTTTQPFTLSDASQVSVPIMHRTGSFPYYQGANFQALSLPYGSGRLSMIIILPTAGVSLSSFVASLRLDELTGWIGSLNSVGGSVGLPRFSATYQTQGLTAVLGTLGMSVAMCAPVGVGADFSGLSSRPVCVSDAVHQTVVEVDEGGTVAAAATTITVHTTVAQANVFTMTMDRPFLYLIRDSITGELLFLGALLNPS